MALCLIGFLLPKWRSLSIITLMLCLGAIRWQIHDPGPSALQQILEQKTSIRQEARFVITRSLSSSTLSARLLSLNYTPVDEEIFINGFDNATIGTTYHGLMELKAIRKDPILDVFASKHTAAAYPLLPPQVDSLQARTSKIAKLRQYLIQRLDRNLGDYAALGKALLLGETEYKQEQRLLLTRAGIVHLVVVSGLHVFFLYFVMMIVLRLLLPFRIAELAFLILIAGYAALNNWSPPITRAILMITLGILAGWLSRPLSGIQNLAISLLIITAVNPHELFSISLQLSFTAVALIVAAVPKLGKSSEVDTPLIQRSFYRTVNYIMLTIIVSIGIAPLTLYYFGTASLNGILANLLGIPIIALLLPLSMLILMLPAGSWIASLLLLSYQALSDLWQYWLEFCAELPLYLANHWLSLTQTLALVAVLILLLIVIRKRFRLALKLAIPVAVFACFAFFVPLSRPYDIHLFNAGVADCSLIRLPGDISLMIDTGGISGYRAETRFSAAEEHTQSSWMQRKLIPWLARKGIRKIDYLLLTHLHSDHAGGFTTLSQNLKIRHLIISAAAIKSPAWKDISASLNLNSTKIIAIQDTTTIHLGKVPLKILHPDQAFSSSDENDQSIVCRLDLGGRRYLFTGDIENPAEEYLAARYPDELRADFLKVAHHGSRGSSSASFLSAVNPQVAWITSTNSNIYGFPHLETIQRLNRHNSRIILTGNGSIRHRFAQKD